MRKQISCQNWEASWSNCTAHVLQRSKDHPKKQLQNGVATAPRHWDIGGQHPPAGQSSSSQSLDWELDTVNSSPTSTDWKFPTQTNGHVARVLKPPTTSCNPAPPSMTLDARHGPVRWRPTESFGDWLRHCNRLRTLPYSPDWDLAWPGTRKKKIHPATLRRVADWPCCLTQNCSILTPGQPVLALTLVHLAADRVVTRWPVFKPCRVLVTRWWWWWSGECQESWFIRWLLKLPGVNLCRYTSWHTEKRVQELQTDLAVLPRGAAYWHLSDQS